MMGEGEVGYCGLRRNVNNRLVDYSREEGVVECYHDPLPTNCVAAWSCPGCSEVGFPEYSYTSGPEYGYKNLAVFYGSCTYDCLFCQNWHYRENTLRLGPRMTPEQLASYVDERTSCICYFGGDPSSQVVHAIKTSQLALERKDEEIIRICFESNGNFSRWALKKIARIVMESGGCIKFDLKAWDEGLNIAMCGVSNRATLDNFRRLARYHVKRRSPPFLVASTLLVPGYIDAYEVERIAEYVASFSSDIPYSLLAFHPQYQMKDLPTTSWKLAEECFAAAKKHLENVRLGNVHLLS